MQSINNLSGLADEVRSMERRHNEEVVQLKMRLGRVLLDLKSKNMLEFRVAVRENGLLMNTFNEILQILPNSMTLAKAYLLNESDKLKLDDLSC